MERRHTNTYIRKYLDGKYVVTNTAEGEAEPDGNVVSEAQEASAPAEPEKKTTKKLGKKSHEKAVIKPKSA